uniref:Uncharacterized protein n=1 Tax=Rhizophora mucronata TaxID=61149 RepID=A0A2P2P106_RHIMU
MNIALNSDNINILSLCNHLQQCHSRLDTSMEEGAKILTVIKNRKPILVRRYGTLK